VLLALYAQDDDTGVNANVSYSILAGSGINTFTLNKTSGKSFMNYCFSVRGLFSDYRRQLSFLLSFSINANICHFTQSGKKTGAKSVYQLLAPLHVFATWFKFTLPSLRGLVESSVLFTLSIL